MYKPFLFIASCILNINPKAIKLQLEFFQFPVPLLYPMDHNYSKLNYLLFKIHYNFKKI